MKFAVQQPQFLPWEGYWHRVAECDAFVFYAGVQYPSQNYTNRVRVGPDKTWMVLPVIAPHGTLIKDVKIDPTDVQKLARRIKQTYCTKKKPYAGRLDNLVSLMETWDIPRLLDFLVISHLEVSKLLDRPMNLVLEGTEYTGTPQEKLQACLEACKLTEGTMLTSERVRGWYEPIVKDVLYQQITTEVRDESFLARVVEEENPFNWPTWGWAK